MKLLTDREMNKAYMGSDYHPGFKLRMEVKHGIERVKLAQAELTREEIVKYLEHNTEEAFGIPYINYAALQALKKGEI